MGSLCPWIMGAESLDWCRLSTSPLTALRIVFAIALERQTAAACMGEFGERAISYWPSNLYGVLATQAARNSHTWTICARAVDESLGEAGRRYQSLSPARLARVFRESGHLLDAREVAALLWALLRQHEPVGARIAGRLGAEFEMLAIQRPAEISGTANRAPDPTPPRAHPRPAIGSSRH